MTTLKDDIALVRKAIEDEDAMVLFDGGNSGAYYKLKRICAAAENTLTKTVKKWTVECDARYETGGEDHFRHGTNTEWVPYPDRAKAVKFATHMLDSKEPIYSNVSVIEVEVDDK
jgi:hypothetical protein